MIDDELELILLDDMANDDKAFISDESSGCGGILSDNPGNYDNSWFTYIKSI